MNMATSKTSHQRQMRRRKNVNPYFKNFVENTSLHGVKYIGNPNNHWIQRGFWCIVVIGFIISLFAIYRMKINKWKEDPMTIEISHIPRNISTLAIPVFTICGPVHPSVEQVEYFEEEHGDEIYKIADILGMSRKPFDEMFNMSSTRNGTDSNRERFVISDSSLETFFRYTLMNSYSKLETSFYFGLVRQTFMFRGLCWSSNMLPASKIYKIDTVRNFLRNDLESGFKQPYGQKITYQLNTETIHGFPSFTKYWTVDGKDWFYPQSEIPVLVRKPGITYYPAYFREKGDKFIGRDNIYRFTIHNPWDVPSAFMRWHRFQPSTYSRILIEHELIIKYPVDENDFLYKVPSAKQCYNTTEKTLDFFQYYTRQNCLMECSTKRALKECGCVLFFMPHNESTYICSDEYSSCAVNVAKATHYDTGDRKFEDSCDCLPSCNYTDYKVISYESGIRRENDYSLQQVDMVFRNELFHPKVRTYTYNNNEMIDSTIVYLDVFLGISIMTVAEIFYYMLLYVIDHLKSKIQRMLERLYML